MTEDHKMKLKLGKCYLTADGRTIGPMTKATPTLFRTAHEDDDLNHEVWEEDGSVFCGKEGEEGHHIVANVDLPEAPSTEKKWGDMTDAEKGALLLAHHDGKTIEARNQDSKWYVVEGPIWRNDIMYRVKREPKRKTITMVGADFSKGRERWKFSQTGFYGNTTHQITFDLIDGEPDCTSIGMEKKDA